MALSSKKGACSANVQPAKANCLQHARREGKVPSYVNPHLTNTNRVVFEDELIRSRKSIMPLVRQREKLYEEKVKQKCQKSFTPFREDVLHLKEGITDEQLMAFKEKAEQLTGWKVIGIWLHQDEGHVRSKFIEGDEEFKINYHAHVLYDCQNLQTGKAVRLGRDYFRKRQDILAECTGMERGNPASETGRRHRSSQQQRIVAQEERIEKLMAVAEELEAERDAAKEELEEIQIAKAGKEKIMGFFGQSEKDKQIKALEGQLQALKDDQVLQIEKTRQDASTEARKDERQIVIMEIKEAAGGLYISGKDGKETAQDIGRSWRRSFDENKTLKKEIQENVSDKYLAIFMKIPIVAECINIIRKFVHSVEKFFSQRDAEVLSFAMGDGDAVEREEGAEALGKAAYYQCGVLGQPQYSSRWKRAQELLKDIARNDVGEKLEHSNSQTEGRWHR